MGPFVFQVPVLPRFASVDDAFGDGGLRETSRCQEERASPPWSLSRGKSLSGDSSRSHVSALKRGVCRVPFWIYLIESPKSFVPEVILQVVGTVVNLEIREREREEERSIFRISRLGSDGKWIQPGQGCSIVRGPRENEMFARLAERTWPTPAKSTTRSPPFYLRSFQLYGGAVLLRAVFRE